MSEQEFIGNTSQADLDEGKCKLHHYVPIWLQKGFADDDGLLWTADKNHGELKRVWLFFVEGFSPYSWAFLPAGASLQWPFREDIKQASAYPRLSGGQPSLVTAPNTLGLLPDRRAPFWTFARRSGTVPWEGRQTCDGCDDRIPGTYIRRAPNLRPLHRSPEPSPVRSGRCCLRGCQSPPLVQRSPADERERTRTGTAPAGPGFGSAPG